MPDANASASELFDLTVFEFDRRGAAENGHRHLEAGAALVDFLDHAVERRERAVRDANLLADLEADRRLGMIDTLGDLALDALGFTIRGSEPASPCRRPGSP